MSGLLVVAFFVLLFSFFFFRRFARRKALDNMTLKPFRYPTEIRRSTWANRGRF